MKRSKFNLSNYHLTTFDMGKLIPANVFPVLPGDTVELNTNALIRMNSLVTPVMHPVNVRLHHFFVPYRLLWSDWEDFITGADDTLTPPGIVPSVAHNWDNIYGYMGMYAVLTRSMPAFPVRAYNAIYNEYYHEKDLTVERTQDDITMASIMWEKDYFTSCMPEPQQGDTLTVPIRGLGVGSLTSTAGPHTVYEGDLTTGTHSYPHSRISTTGAIHMKQETLNGPMDVGINIREFKENFMMQSFKEARNRYGDDYVDYLRYLGINPQDSRLTRPEFLGGSKATVQFSEVLNTDTLAGDIGTPFGHGITALKGRRFRKFIPEHGVVMSLISVRPKTVYVGGEPREHYKWNIEDFWTKELENIGDQEVKNGEVYGLHTTPDDVFGYQQRYDEYRHRQSIISGEMTGVYDSYHLGRIFTSDPALNGAFRFCNPTNRIYQTTTNHGMQAMISNRVVARRLIRKTPRRATL